MAASRPDRLAGGAVQTSRGLLRTLLRRDRGLVSYGPSRTVQYRQAAAYVEPYPQGREAGAICRCRHRPKHELVINLKTAKALGITVPPALLARGDDVIEYPATFRLMAPTDLQRCPLKCR